MDIQPLCGFFFIEKWTLSGNTGLAVSFPGPRGQTVHFHYSDTSPYHEYHFMHVRVLAEKLKKKECRACCTYCVELPDGARGAPMNNLLSFLPRWGDVSNLARRKSLLLCSECEVLKHLGVTWLDTQYGASVYANIGTYRRDVIYGPTMLTCGDFFVCSLFSSS